MGRDNSFFVMLPGAGPRYVCYGETIRIDKADLAELPDGFCRTLVNSSAYRDTDQRGSLRVVDCGDHWSLRVERFNPESGLLGFLGHIFVDAPKIGFGAVFALGWLAGVALRTASPARR